jgi:hypothetical protein
MAVIAVALVLLLAWEGVAYAEAPTGEGPFDTMAPSGEWMQLEEGEYDWYSFHFDYDSRDEAVHEPIEIRMFAEPYASATLTVRNQDQIDQWVRDGENLHFGCCTMVDRDRNNDGFADYALVPTGAWTEMEANGAHWYVFDFDYDDDATDAVRVRLYNEPYEDVVLTVRNAEQANMWRQVGENEHFGCCSLVDVDNDDDGRLDYAEWEGSLRSSGRYFIVVESAEGAQTPAFYRFTLSGDNLSFPRLVEQTAGVVAPIAEPKLAPEPVAMAEPMMEALEPDGLMGTGPDFAMQPTEAWTELEKGKQHWYKFTYDDDDDNAEPVAIHMFTDPSDATILTVRNGDQAEAWRQDGENLHFGCCTPAKTTSGDEEGDEEIDEKDLAYAQWVAQLTESGEYYIVIEHAENVDEPGFYRFEISGDGVAF